MTASGLLEQFVPLGGKHCITTALRQIFAYHGYPLSEELLFGLASGLSFLYLNSAAGPLISGRTKVGAFEAKLAERLHITIRCRTCKDSARAEETARRMLDGKEPVLVYVDMPYLPYLNLAQSSHFGSHAVVLCGYDREARQFLVSDRDSEAQPIPTPGGPVGRAYHLVSYEDLAKARASVHRPFPANNRFLSFSFAGYEAPGKVALRAAIRETCENMLAPPAHLLGLEGIAKFSRALRQWQHLPPETLRAAGMANYFQISRDGGTGGGIFRQMYGGFLTEAAPLLKEERLAALGGQFSQTARRWDAVAAGLRQLSRTGDTGLLPELSEAVAGLCARERALYTALLQVCDS